MCDQVKQDNPGIVRSFFSFSFCEHKIKFFVLSFKRPEPSFTPLSLPKNFHELYTILANKIIAYELTIPHENLSSSVTWLLCEFGERYQVRELFRAVT